MRQLAGRTLCMAILAGLGACGQAGDSPAADKSMAPADVGKAVSEMAFQFEPGKYRTTIDIAKFEMPGVPAQAAEQMKAMMTRKTSSEYCLSPEQAKRGMDVMKEQMGKGQCKFEKFDASGGTVESVFTCNSGQGMALKSTSRGTYDSTGSKVDVVADMSIPGGRSLHLEQTVTMVRIGDCA